MALHYSLCKYTKFLIQDVVDNFLEGNAMINLKIVDFRIWNKNGWGFCSGLDQSEQ